MWDTEQQLEAPGVSEKIEQREEYCCRLLHLLAHKTAAGRRVSGTVKTTVTVSVAIIATG